MKIAITSSTIPLVCVSLKTDTCEEIFPSRITLSVYNLLIELNLVAIDQFANVAMYLYGRSL